MRTIKLYENFGQDRITFSSKIGVSRRTQVDLYDEPIEMRSAYVKFGVVNWDLELITKEWGIALGDTPVAIRSIRLDYEVEDEESGDIVEKEMEIAEGSLSYDQFTTEINSFPLGLESIDINMRHTMDPKFWKFKLYLGNTGY